MQPVSEADIIAALQPLDLNTEESTYLRYHSTRLAFAMNAIRSYGENHELNKLLDIGPHFLTRCICEFFPDIELSTLGWKFERLVPTRLYTEHIQFDLNNCGVEEIKSDRAPFDLIVFSETIEHLYTSPLTVLPALRNLLRPGGGLFIQTPNAATLKARWELLKGRNPYELIRESRTNPGHFREYTLDELISYAQQTGFSIESAEYCSYWRDDRPVFAWFENTVPTFRQGLSLLMKKEPTENT